MAEKYIKLFNDFPPVTTDEWKTKIKADLAKQKADYDRKLVWRTNEGFPVQPFYREENLKEVEYLDTLPGQFPYVRGTKINGNDWFVRQNIVVKDLEEANKKALNALMKGATSVGFVFESCKEVTTADLSILLKDVCLEAIEVNFVTRCHAATIAEAFTDYVASGKWKAEDIKASVTCDPFGNYLLFGRLKNGVDGALDQVKHLVEKTATLPNFRVIAVEGKNYGNAGATTVQELGFALAQGAEYLSALTEAGVAIDDVAKNIKFDLSISGNYFMEIAKFRAGRLLWAQIVKAYDPKCDCACKMNVYAESGIWNKTFYDPYVNLLRTQTEMMSASLAGVDSMAALPFNVVYDASNDFSDRIARNQQLLLREESHFDKVVDPGAGSYYIEELTASIADEAWKLFLEIQDLGGFIAAAKAGFIQKQVSEMAAKRATKVAQRRENFIGINQFPNFTEHLEKDAVADDVLKSTDLTADDAEIPTIKFCRGAQEFEAIRVATDRYSKDHKRPLAFMLTIGNLTMRKARAQFSCNFFAVAGFDVKDNNGFETVEEGVKAAKEAGAEIIVVCSSDDEYAELAPAVYNLAKDDAQVVVAGAPKCADELKAKGIEHFVNVRSNVLEELKGYQKAIGIC